MPAFGLAPGAENAPLDARAYSPFGSFIRRTPGMKCRPQSPGITIPSISGTVPASGHNRRFQRRPDDAPIAGAAQDQLAFRLDDNYTISNFILRSREAACLPDRGQEIRPWRRWGRCYGFCNGEGRPAWQPGGFFRCRHAPIAGAVQRAKKTGAAGTVRRRFLREVWDPFMYHKAAAYTSK
jgi:hypothetical protein